MELSAWVELVRGVLEGARLRRRPVIARLARHGVLDEGREWARVVCSCCWGYCFGAMHVRRGLGARLWGLAPVVLVPAAAFAVHQLRYYLAYGSAAGVELQRTGHSYLHSVVPWIVGLVALAVGGFLWSLGRAMAGQRSFARFTVSFLGLWAVCAGSLVAIFATQEFLEGLFATGHPAGLAGIFGFGGWWSIPCAGCVGLVLAAVFHGARWVLEEVAQRYARARWTPVVRVAPTPRPADALVARLAPLAEGRSGRGPPR